MFAPKVEKKVIMVTNCVSFINFHYLCVCVFIVVPSVDLALKAINTRLYIQISTCPTFCIYIHNYDYFAHFNTFEINIRALYNFVKSFYL